MPRTKNEKRASSYVSIFYIETSNEHGNCKTTNMLKKLKYLINWFKLSRLVLAKILLKYLVDLILI